MFNQTIIYILAGGLGSRLGNLSNQTPKSLIKFNKKPFIYYQLKFLEENNIKNIVLCIGKHAKKIKDWVKCNWDGDVNIKFSEDGDTQLGTGGALYKALCKYPSKNTCVMYGDTLLNFEISSAIEAYNKSNHTVLMTIYKNFNKFDKSNISIGYDTKIEYCKSKPINKKYTHIDYGFIIINQNEFLKFKNGGVFDFAEYLEYESMLGRLGGFEVSKRFYEIGTNVSIKEFQKYLQSFQ